MRKTDAAAEDGCGTTYRTELMSRDTAATARCGVTRAACCGDTSKKDSFTESAPQTKQRKSGVFLIYIRGREECRRKDGDGGARASLNIPSTCTRPRSDFVRSLATKLSLPDVRLPQKLTPKS